MSGRLKNDLGVDEALARPASIARTPIDPSGLMVGDLVRCETTDSVLLGGEFTATEFRWAETHDPEDVAPGVQYFLLERPTPPFALPSKPTLGWLAIGDEDFSAHFYHVAETAVRGKRVFRDGVELVARPQDVTSFTHATAVPSGAIADLRESNKWCDEPRHSLETSDSGRRGAIFTFLAAVDRANGTAS